jgi:phosphatidylinositol-3-phosphatase
VRLRPPLALGAALLALVTVVTGSATAAAPAPSLPPVRHVFVINLENKDYDATWGPNSAAPYLSRTLRGQGQLLTQYYGVAHQSLGNYLAQISGQGPNVATQSDCPVYGGFAQFGTTSDGQAVGQGCVYPASVPTLADQFAARGLRWRAYLEDMGTPCRHPAVGAPDDTQKARVGDQYAARHNPFVYFHSVIDSPSCAEDDVPLTALPGDLASEASTPNLVYVTPNLCHDAHDAPCVDGEPGGLASADAWLRTWVPRITSSPAFRQDGLLVITFDESDGAQSDASACCGEGPGPNTPLPGITGLGGGRIGALVISPFVAPNSWNDTPYNHYGLLRTIEDLNGLGHLGYAGSPSVRSFGLDVFAAH